MNQSVTLNQLLARWAEFVADTDWPTPPAYDGPDVEIGRFVEDSRLVQPGDCFVARLRQRPDRSVYSDGHPWIGRALGQGATCIIANADHPVPATLPAGVAWLSVPDSAITLTWLAAALHRFPARDMLMIGVTGTDGKTSIANLLYEILNAAGHKTGLISTIRAVIGNRAEPLGLHVTTPQAPEIQALLRRMADDGVTHCVLEVTSMGLAEHRADTAFFDLAVFSNVTHEHLDYHGSFEGYLAAKLRLAELALRTTVINGDDPGSYEPLRAVPKPRTVTYALENREMADVWGRDIRFGPDRTAFVIDFGRKPTVTPDGYAIPQAPVPMAIETPLIGRFNVSNMLAAAAAAHSLAIPLPAIRSGLHAVQGLSGRMERISAGQPFLVVVDFAHTPNALHKAIEAARGMTDGRVIAVFGSAGRRDVAKRRLMAETSARLADLTVLTAEDPRQEPLEEILEMMAAGCLAHGGVENETFWRVPDRGQAIWYALTLARPNDVVLICGKGHEQSMCFGEIEYPWDDRDATRAALKAFLSGLPAPDLGLPTGPGA
jgi:UDP-N-acetylmuramoyl-L-alanyl-D-glutamate--2,6-diaminopimelate ligase